MKHTISVTITSLIIGALIVYCIFLITQQTIYVSPSFIGNEIATAIGLTILLLIIWFYSTVGSSHITKPKLTLGVLGVLLLFVGAYVFVDVAGTNTFLSDTSRIVWVYILIAGITWFIGISPDSKNTTTGWTVHRVKGAEVIEI